MLTVVVVVAPCVMEEGGCKAVFIAGTDTDAVEHTYMQVCVYRVRVRVVKLCV